MGLSLKEQFVVFFSSLLPERQISLTRKTLTSIRFSLHGNIKDPFF